MGIDVIPAHEAGRAQPYKALLPVTGPPPGSIQPSLVPKTVIETGSAGSKEEVLQASSSLAVLISYHTRGHSPMAAVQPAGVANGED